MVWWKVFEGIWEIGKRMRIRQRMRRWIIRSCVKMARMRAVQ